MPEYARQAKSPLGPLLEAVKAAFLNHDLFLFHLISRETRAIKAAGRGNLYAPIAPYFFFSQKLSAFIKTWKYRRSSNLITRSSLCTEPLKFHYRPSISHATLLLRVTQKMISIRT